MLLVVFIVNARGFLLLLLFVELIALTLYIYFLGFSLIFSLENFFSAQMVSVDVVLLWLPYFVSL